MDTRIFQYVKEDDFIECFIFPLVHDVQIGDDLIDNIYQSVQEIVDTLAQKYVWHKDVFTIQKRLRKTNVLSVDSNADLPSHIYGICHYGDNIEDEWFIVYMIKQITKKLDSLAARVVDSDGEFLLIEAANSLPPWASPENCTNRVFFQNGSLHLINPDNYENINELTIKEALSKMCSNSDDYLVSAEIQKDIFQHLEEYPEKISQNLHRTIIYTPIGVAALLREDPGLISAAVHAFCNRDPIDMKVCRAMKYFPPENRVNTSAIFTKYLYAMILNANFSPDRRTGWNLPLINSPQYKSHSLGAKLACGFEILVSQAQPNNNLESNKAWHDYLQSLNNRNYFQGLLEGSNGHNDLLHSAKDYFENNLNFIKVGPKLGGRILDMLSNFSLDDKEFRKNEPFLPKDDDDKWLYVDPAELESMVQKRYGRKTLLPINGETVPSEFSTKISEFLEHTSGIEGVEFPNEAGSTSEGYPQRPKRGIKVKKGQTKGVSFSNEIKSRSPSPKTKNRIDFDSDQFATAIQNILDLVIPEDNWDLDSGSDVSEYGSGDELETNILELASSEGREQNVMDKYMADMDSELANTDLSKSFEPSKSQVGGVDVDTNALKNLHKSVEEEMGGMGPASSILGPLAYTHTENLIPIDEEID